MAPDPAARPAARQADRIHALDVARGVAVTLMILSHGVKGLLPFEQFPSWGLVPIHLLTKISSSLFIIVFGMSLAIIYLPAACTPAWAGKRTRLLVRGLVVLFWYKVLTIVEMFGLYSPEEILAALSYRAFPVYAEILDFYALALLWLPFALPLWKRARVGVQLVVPLVLGVAALLLYRGFDFWGSEALRALLVEDERHYTWGQLSRGPLIFVGLLAARPVLRWYGTRKGRLLTAAGFLGVALLLLGGFLFAARGDLHEELVRIARNVGKHPPELRFMLFSVGGAFAVLALAIAGGRRLSRLLAPVTTIGRDALQAFVCHLSVLFVFYRYLLGYWHGVSYLEALGLTALLIVVTAVWVKAVHWVRAKQSGAS